MDQQTHTIPLPDHLVNQRLDRALAQLLPQYSRTRLQHWLKIGLVKKNEQILTSRYQTQSDDIYTVTTKVEPSYQNAEASDIPLEIIHEDDTLLVVNKPPGLITHPGAGQPTDTLMNGLLCHNPALSALPRAGLVHRLDKNTSGLLIVAKSIQSHHALVQALQQRLIKRQYVALVTGHVISGGSIDAPIGRDPHHRTKMSIHDRGKPAITHYRVLERFRLCSLLEITLVTGRTHQIRVHMRSAGHTLVGDTVYGYRTFYPKHCDPELKVALDGFNRQALHAQHLSLPHPVTNEPMSWRCPLPDDFQALLNLLKQDIQQQKL